ncbi:hypothetical protein MOQ72_42290 [Saccharopolyspora sp. K220]|uniref:hypothetical protein n=1 Tax=Saccharopolyspora soli TaxID=2926618 RepID=UPI001F581343|nr:hypothetical protein [Saccharopolyspora soli]MCI2424048.1 hypothetical protein [Saccharopolyspora soli]
MNLDGPNAYGGESQEANALHAVINGDGERARNIVDGMSIDGMHKLMHAAEKLATIARISWRDARHREGEQE